ncbi:MAG TPA: ethanolamine permease [Rhodospirillales bacterium]|nr:ethanolamine permease [Rhodospirillales bacterium]
MSQKPTLKRALSTIHLWGIAVGLVISGEYFGWNYGWREAGTIGFLWATLIITVLYTTFIFSFTELTTAIPHAGGPFAYSHRAFGPLGGLIAGYATLVEFVFAPPAIAYALGGYAHFMLPAVPVLAVAIGAYFLFVGVNILGIRQAALFELFVTVLAVVELLVFMGIVAPAFSFTNFVASNEEFGVAGIMAAIPFAIWFYLAIEGVAMAAEEAKDPTRTIPRAYISGILTLVVLALGVMILSGGVGDWRLLSNVDYPLPEAMAMVVGRDSGWTHMLVSIGLFGLVASFHGIIIGYSRQMFALARAGYLPSFLAAIHPRFRTPHWALVAGGVIGIVAILSGRTAELITMSAFGALVLYVISMAALFKLRAIEPDLARPYRAPLYPLFPAIALFLSLGSLLVMFWFNREIGVIFIGMFALAFVWFAMTGHLRSAAASDELLAPVPPLEGALARGDVDR